MAKSPQKKHGTEVLGTIVAVIVMIAAAAYGICREQRFNRLYEVLIGETGATTNSTTKTWFPLLAEPKEETYSLTSTVFFLDEERNLVNALEVDHTYQVVIRLSNQSSTKLNNIKIALENMIDPTDLDAENREYVIRYITKAEHKSTEVISQEESKVVSVLGVDKAHVSYVSNSASYVCDTAKDTHSLKDTDLLIPEIGAKISDLNVDNAVKVRFSVTVQSIEEKPDMEELSPETTEGFSKGAAGGMVVLAFLGGMIVATVFALIINACASKKSKKSKKS